MSFSPSFLPAIAGLSFAIVAQAAANPAAACQSPVLRPMVPIRFGDDAANEWTTPFFEGAEYDPAVTDPEELFGQPIGSRLASHAEILTMLRAMAATSDRVKLSSYGRTFEGRELVTVTITSPANHARMDEIRENARLLFDPRLASAEVVDGLAEGQPGVAWMGYGIHGDETSASEAAVPFVYHLAASTDDSVVAALERVVVVLDPCLNPDGRERIRSMVEQSAGYRANLDDGAMQRGRWPGGRGNHYLFDMNRDWMAGEAPETRGRWARLLELPPQLFVDAHEMSGLDTFLFYPQASPRNGYLPERLNHWQSLLAADAARVFDAFGWGYYTREWADALYPGYSDAWGSLTGAIGMLYEQGRTIGAPLQRESGEIVSYRETVHGQIAASLSNLMTFAQNKEAILGDYVAHRRLAMDPESKLGRRAFAVVPSRDVTRDARFLRALLGQGIEVQRADAAFEAKYVEGALGERDDTLEFPAGTWIVPAAQPQGALVRAYLDFDQRLDEEFLAKERASIERGQGSKIYDVTGWDLGRQFGVQGFWIDAPGVAATAAGPLVAPSGPVGDLASAYAWVADGDDSRSLAFAARAMELGAQVHVSDEDFRARGGSGALALPRGSFLLRRHENEAGIEAIVAQAAQESGAVVHGVSTGRSADEGPDLGGGHFQLLRRPRVALFSNTPVSRTDFGHVWSYLDQDLGVPVTLVDAQGDRRVDLDRYNVLIAPPGLGSILAERKDALVDWVRGGGTLIVIGSTAAAVAKEDSGLSENRRRRDVLEELDGYGWRAERERKAYEIAIDMVNLYGGAVDAADATAPQQDSAPGQAPGAAPAPESGTPDAEGPKAASPAAETLDEWRRQFSPEGVILRARMDPAAWITAGVGAHGDEEDQPLDLAVPFAGHTVLMPAVRPALRLASASELRLAGLLWPEARVRIADSAWLTVEPLGRGQVISFAASPVFRGSWRGTSRLFGNAVLIGPGMTD
ncbi:Zinc carboxypeptidase [Planctomycetes bacterium Poly30]|uniref:Zinc carboxypeptidase n=1 Tax=Saltatorellus ferox TaxID=2528018 RepID=A0A518EN35_9BACT|nr:Zinc carboxypeptidase [Planctomycetes bacterium Poly30]